MFNWDIYQPLKQLAPQEVATSATMIFQFLTWTIIKELHQWNLQSVAVAFSLVRARGPPLNLCTRAPALGNLGLATAMCEKSEGGKILDMGVSIQMGDTRKLYIYICIVYREKSDEHEENWEVPSV